MTRARGTRTNVFVTIGSMKYGFAASANTNSHRVALGHTTFTGQAGVFFGANSPKPNRASKEISGYTVSSYCDPSMEDDLRTADWVITRFSRRRGMRTAGRTRTVFVPMPGGYNYVWNLTSAEMTHAAILGFAQASASTTNMVWGSSPKPPRAYKKTAGSTTSTFIKPTQATLDAAVAAGWTITSIDYDLLPDT